MCPSCLQHHQRKTLNPTFNATYHFLVQEPKTQALRLQVYDWDGVHFKVGTRLRVSAPRHALPAFSSALTVLSKRLLNSRPPMVTLNPTALKRLATLLTALPCSSGPAVTSAMLKHLLQRPSTRLGVCLLQELSWVCWATQEVFSSINVIKGIRESFGAKSFMARTAVDIRPIYDDKGQEVDKWYDLGQNDWSHEEGTVSPSPSARIDALHSSPVQPATHKRNPTVVPRQDLSAGGRGFPPRNHILELCAEQQDCVYCGLHVGVILAGNCCRSGGKMTSAGCSIGSLPCVEAC